MTIYRHSEKLYYHKKQLASYIAMSVIISIYLVPIIISNQNVLPFPNSL